MNGRHSPAGPPRPKGDATAPTTARDDARTGRVRKVALWAFLALCVVLIAWVAWGFLQFDHDIDNPREGGFSGWQCDAAKDCGA